MATLKISAAALAALLLLSPAPAFAAKSASKKAPAKAKSEQRQQLESAVTDYKKSLDELIARLEEDVSKKEADAAKVRELLSSGIVSRNEVEKRELEVATAKAELAKRRQELETADALLAEAVWADQVAVAPSRTGAYRARAAVLRGSGRGWSIHNISNVQSYFASRFGRSLPISAFGQSAVHNRMGWDHSNSVDVPVHPDSPEGQAIIAYLRSAGIPFLAFRAAVPGQSTGAHIHIGYPSGRL